MKIQHNYEYKKLKYYDNMLLKICKTRVLNFSILES